MIRDFFTSNMWFNVTTFIFALLGIFFTIYFSIKANKKKSPRFITSTISLLKTGAGNIGGLTVSYKGRELDNLSTTKVAFWNNGRDTIRYIDVSNIDPLLFVGEEGVEILSCDIIKQTKLANNVVSHLDADQNQVHITFDYLDFRDGFVIKIRHTGKGGIRLQGSIQSVKMITKLHSPSANDQEYHLPNKASKIMYWVGSIGLIAVLLYFQLCGTQHSPLTWSYVLTLVFMIALLTLVYAFMSPQLTIPEELEQDFYDCDL